MTDPTTVTLINIPGWRPPDGMTQAQFVATWGTQPTDWPLLPADSQLWVEPSRNVPGNRRLKDFALAALEVTPEKVRTYEPTILDVGIVQALLQGCTTTAKIAEFTDRKDATVLDALTDAVRAAWCFQQVSLLAGTRVGLVTASLLRKAVAGDTKAIELFLKLYGKLADLHVVAHTDADFSHFTDDDLKAHIRAEAAQVLDLETPTNEA